MATLFLAWISSFLASMHSSTKHHCVNDSFNIIFFLSKCMHSWTHTVAVAVMVNQILCSAASKRYISHLAYIYVIQDCRLRVYIHFFTHESGRCPTQAIHRGLRSYIQRGDIRRNLNRRKTKKKKQ